MNTEKNRQQSEEDKGNPPKRQPQIIRILRDFKGQYHRYAAEYEKQKADHAGNEWTMASWTRKVGQFTIVLAVIAAVSAGVSILQWRSMQGQLDEMRSSGEDAKASVKAAQDSAKAAQDALSLAKENSQRQLRAYLFIKDQRISLGADAVTITFSVHNAGQTPAYETNAEIFFSITGSRTHGETRTIPAQKIAWPKVLIGRDMKADGSATLAFSSVPLEISLSFKDEASPLLVNFIISYKDVFGRQHNLRSQFARERIGEKWDLVTGQQTEEDNGQ